MYIEGGSALKNCLILLTNSYPYSSEEAFLEPEMPYLAKEFDKIIMDVDSVSKKYFLESYSQYEFPIRKK